MTDDKNIRLETNSALYLVIKDELIKLPTGFMSTENGTKIEVDSKVDQIDNWLNNPASLLKVKVTEISTGFESKVTINMYHTNQGFHIQGGRRNGSVTSCSLVADYLVDYFKMIFLKHAKRI